MPNVFRKLIFVVFAVFSLAACTKKAGPVNSDADGFYGRTTKDYFNTSTPTSGTIIHTDESGKSTQYNISGGKITSSTPVDAGSFLFSGDSRAMVISAKKGIFEASPQVTLSSVTGQGASLPPATIDTFCTGVSETGYYSQFQIVMQNGNYNMLAFSGTSAYAMGSGITTKVLNGTVLSYQRPGFGTLQINELAPSPSDKTFYKSTFVNATGAWQNLSSMYCHLNNVPVTSLPADHLQLIAGNNQAQLPYSQLIVDPKVRALDIYGNPVAGVSLNFFKNYGEFQFSLPIVTTDTNGYASVSIQLMGTSGYGEFMVSEAGQSLPDLAQTGNPVLRFNLKTLSFGNGTFQAPMSYGPAFVPQGIAIGDFNGDRVPDIAFGNLSTNTVDVVLFQSGIAGGILSEASYPTGNAPWGVVTGDFNQDGKLDIAVTNSGSNSVGILIGNGDGTFQSQLTMPAGNHPTEIAIGDFNQDGIPDLAVVNTGENTIGIFLGVGDGTFKPEVTFATGSNPSGITLADFNQDGILDLAVTNAGSNTVGIFLGKGDGTFRTMVSYPTGFGPSGIALGDFNGDGITDLALANSTDGTVSVLLGKTDGTFQTQSIWGVGTAPTHVAIGDFNGDGKSDIAVTNNGSNTASILLGNGDGTFQNQAAYPTMPGPGPMGAFDFNGDGKTDLIIGNTGDGSVSVLLGN